MAEACQGCPWRGGLGTVRSPERKTSSGIVILGEGPAREEVAQGRCFVGPSGMELEKTLRRAGFARSEVAIENAFACHKPPRASPREEVAAVEACRAHVEEFLAETQPRGALLLGGRALRSVAPAFAATPVNDGLLRHRGSVWHRREIEAANAGAFARVELPESLEWVVATIHPAAIIRRERIERFPAMGYRAIPALDLRRLAKATREGRALAPLERRIGLPSLSELREAGGIVFDLETRRDSGKPTLVGVQRSDGGPVWQSAWGAARDWMAEAMRLPIVKIGHNIHGFDLHVLAEEGIEVAEPWFDTMAAGGMCEPDMARGLYFQQALYVGDRRPFHKELSGADLSKTYEARRQAALRRAWRATGLPPSFTWDSEWDWFYNALDVDSTRMVYVEQVDRALKEGWL